MIEDLFGTIPKSHHYFVPIQKLSKVYIEEQKNQTNSLLKIDATSLQGLEQNNSILRDCDVCKRIDKQINRNENILGFHMKSTSKGGKAKSQKKDCIQQMVLKQLGIHPEKVNESGYKPYVIHKNQLNMNHRPNIKCKKHKNT